MSELIGLTEQMVASASISHTSGGEDITNIYTKRCKNREKRRRIERMDMIFDFIFVNRS
jgi:hypothetical protein